MKEYGRFGEHTELISYSLSKVGHIQRDTQTLAVRHPRTDMILLLAEQGGPFYVHYIEDL
jgi:hypothetical protein